MSRRRFWREAAHHLMLWAALSLAITSLIFASSSWLGGEWFWGKADLWKVADRATIAMAYLITTIAAYTGLQGLREGGWLRLLLEGERRELTAESQRARERTEVLIMLYYRNAPLADEAIRILQPLMVVLLGCDQADINAYIAHLARNHPSLIVIADITLDRNSVEGTDVAASALIQRARTQANLRGVSAHRMVCDVTGATKPMTIGLLSAAQRFSVDTVYVSCEYDDDLRPIEGTQQVQYLRRFAENR